LQTVESVAMALHSFLASLELLIFNSLYSILEVKYYFDVAGTPWYKIFIMLFNNELNIGAHFALLCVLVHLNNFPYVARKVR